MSLLKSSRSRPRLRKVEIEHGHTPVFAPDLFSEGGNPRQPLDAAVEVVGVQDDEIPHPTTIGDAS